MNEEITKNYYQSFGRIIKTAMELKIIDKNQTEKIIQLISDELLDLEIIENLENDNLVNKSNMDFSDLDTDDFLNELSKKIDLSNQDFNEYK